MAGEIEKCTAVCLSVHPWSRTSHVVSWLSPHGRVLTSVKGAVRPKSAFLGQYDLNYTCEILYYSGGRGDVHALRECTPIEARDALRGDFRALALAGYFRFMAERYAPHGSECAEWMSSLERALDGLARSAGGMVAEDFLSAMLRFDIETLSLAGLRPAVEASSGGFALRGERMIPVPEDVAALIAAPRGVQAGLQTALDAARIVGIYYASHLDLPPDVRRNVLATVTKNSKKG